MLLECCSQYASKFGTLSSGHRTGKGQFSFQSQTKAMPNYRTIALISHASKVMLKILQARLQQYMNCDLPDVQASFRKGRGTRGQIANIRWIMEKASSVQFSHSVVADSLRPHESQHVRPACPSPSSGVHSDSHPSSP